MLLVASLTVMSGATISPALPGIQAQFAADENVQLLSRLVLTIPALTVAICAPLMGGLSDRFGRRTLLLGSIVLYGIAGTSGMYLDSLHGLLIGRGLLGIGVAGSMTITTALVGDYFPGNERDRFMGVRTAFMGFGGMVFLTLGGLFANFDWHYAFLVYGLAFLFLPLAVIFLPEPERHAHGHGPGGRGAHGAGGAHPADTKWKLPIAALIVVAVINSIAFYLIPTQLPFHLIEIGIEEPSMSGIAIGLFTLTIALASLAYGRLRGRIGISGLFAAGFVLMAIGLAMVALTDSYAVISLSLAICGVGMGLVMPNLTAGGIMLAPPHLRGRIAGSVTAGIFIGQFISPFVSQPWIAAFGFAAEFP